MSGKKKNMSGKKPSNGANLSDRRSNLRSKGKAWKEQLVQGVKEKEIADALKMKLDAQRKLMQDEKTRLRNEAKQLDIELGFIDPNATTTPNKMPEWKKQKMFLNEIFPPPVVCRKYNGVMVFRNKLSMQEYQHRVIKPEEWEANALLLDEMRCLYDAERAAERGETTEDGGNDEENEADYDDDEQDGDVDSSQDENEEEEEEEGSGECEYGAGDDFEEQEDGDDSGTDSENELSRMKEEGNSQTKVSSAECSPSVQAVNTDESANVNDSEEEDEENEEEESESVEEGDEGNVGVEGSDRESIDDAEFAKLSIAKD